MTQRDFRAGITLLETLISLAIMGMIAAVLTSGLGGTVRTLDRSAGVSQAVEYAIARRDFRTWLESALMLPAPNDTRPLFEGTPNSVRFLALPPGTNFWLGQAVAIEVGGEGPSATASGLLPETREAGETVIQLAAEETQMSFQYWGLKTAGQRPRWHNDWPNGLGPPDLVKITFSNGSAALPPMTFRPAKTARQSEMSLSSLLPPALPSRP
jgi:type II secretory pathway pseudopilin PulG